MLHVLDSGKSQDFRDDAASERQRLRALRAHEDLVRIVDTAGAFVAASVKLQGYELDAIEKVRAAFRSYLGSWARARPPTFAERELGRDVVHLATSELQNYAELAKGRDPGEAVPASDVMARFVELAHIVDDFVTLNLNTTPEGPRRSRTEQGDNDGPERRE